MLTSMRLYDPDSGEELILWPGRGNDYGIYVRVFDLSFPTIRDNLDERARDDGADDYTEFIGPRSISLYLKITPRGGINSNAAYDQLMGWLSPRRRPELIYAFDGSEERFLTLRGNNVTRTLNMTDLRSRRGEVQLSWVAPEGYQYSYAYQEAGVNSDTSNSQYGRSYDRAYPRDYPEYPTFRTFGTFDVTNAGNEITYPIIVVYGPVTSTLLSFPASGYGVAVNHALEPGEYIEIDERAETYLKNGVEDVSSDVIQNDDPLYLVRGTNSIAHSATDAGSGYRIIIRYRNVYL